MFSLPITPYYKQENCTLPINPFLMIKYDENDIGIGDDVDVDVDPTGMLLGYYALAFTILFTIGVFVFELILDIRQRQCYKKTEFPKQLELVVSKIDADMKNEDLVKGSSNEDDNDDAAAKDEADDNDSKPPPPTTTTTEKEEAEEEEGNDENDNDNDKDDEKKKTTSMNKGPFLPQLHSKFDKSQCYGLDKITFSIVSSIYDVIETILFLVMGFLPYAWDLSIRVGKSGYLYWIIESEIGISLIFLGVVQFVGLVTGLPFELYSTFHIEKKHGFNKQTLSLFITDKIKGLVLSFVIGGPFTALLLYIIKWGGTHFYLYVWFFTFCFSLFMMTIVPVFIMPLFNKYEPLEDGLLKTQIYELADKLNYPLKKLFVMDGSKRSSHSNAFMFGFGSNKRIVLFDTLLEQVHNDEILAILGHELGHWKLGHSLINFCVTQVYFGLAFFAFSKCFGTQELYSAFGFDGFNTPTIIALLLFFQTLWAPIDKILSFVLTVFSRFCEFAADKFSVNLQMSRELQTGLCKIHLENLGAMNPDVWYSTYHYSHPPLVERLSAMMELDKKTK